MRQLTPGQRRALTILSDRETATVVKPGQPVGRLEVTYTVAEFLVVHGYATPDGDTITISATGRAELARPVPDQPRLLATGGSVRFKTLRGGRQAIDDAERNPDADKGYTTRPKQALPDEPEPVDDKTVARFADEARDRHKRTAREQHIRREIDQLTRATRQALRNRHEVGADVTSQLENLKALLAMLRAGDEQQAA